MYARVAAALKSMKTKKGKEKTKIITLGKSHSVLKLKIIKLSDTLKKSFRYNIGVLNLPVLN